MSDFISAFAFVSRHVYFNRKFVEVNHMSVNKKERLHNLYYFSRSFEKLRSHYQALMYENAYKYILNNFPAAI